MGLFIMVTGHFLLFSDKRKKRLAAKVVIALFVAALLDISSGFLIVQGISQFVWVKLAAFAVLQLLGLYLLWLLFGAVWQGITAYK